MNPVRHPDYRCLWGYGKVKMSNRVNQLNDKFLLLLDANRILTSTLDINKLLTVIMELAQKVVNAEASSLLLIDETTGELYFDVTTGVAADEVKRLRLKFGEGIAGWCAAHNRSLIVEDVIKDMRWTGRADDKSGFKTKSIICTPLRYKGSVLGVIEGINSVSRDFFTDDDLPFFEAFANQAAVALENARLFMKLIQEKEKISAAFDGMSESVFVTDKNGTITQANKSAFNLINSENISGLALPKVLTDIGFETPHRFLDFDGKIKISEIVKKTGLQIFLNCIVTKITGRDEEIDGYIFVIRDVTGEKKEELLKRSFLSLISHKLKTPLVSIVGYLHILAEEKLTSNQQKAISVLQSQSERLAELVESLLRFTVIESETLELKKEKVRVSEIISETVNDLSRKLKSVVVEVSDLSDLGEIFADKEKIKEALRCILENAVKFNKSPKKSVKITGEYQDGAVAVNIEDNGVGFPLSEKEKIFEKFYQIEESFTGQVAGAGLGLPLAKRIISAHGGSISVASKINKGSKFTITIPKEYDANG
ncbi:MAG: GAF domain-containing protein [Elusimicrobia bacterium]|nr:GAF domain-containing protein [Elusimicrobiota bacterium]